MKITKFAKRITIHEKGKVQINIAQIMEMLKVANKITKGVLYSVIKALPILIFCFFLSIKAEASAFVVPNLEGSILYDFETNLLVNGVTSKVLAYKDLDLRVGYLSTNKPIIALSYDLKNLTKLGANVRYFWGDWNLTIGAGANYNFVTNKAYINLLSVLVQINFTK